MSRKSAVRLLSAVSLLSLAFAAQAPGYVFFTVGGIRWPGPTVPVRIQLGPTSFTVSDAAVSNTTTNGVTKGKVVSASAAFDLHGVVGMTVTGNGIAAGTVVQSMSNGTTVGLSQRALAQGSGVTLTFQRILKDGSASWNAMAENAFALWNEQMNNVQVTWTEAAPGTPAHDGNGTDATSVQWASTVYGQSFGNNVLAVTLVGPTDVNGNFTSSQLEECDVIFNSKLGFDSYRGGTVSSAFDLHRVATHEFGHVLGLDHPDENHPKVGYTAPQNPPPAIMFAFVDGNIDLPQPDDLAGIHFLYGVPPNAPTTETGHAKLANISTRAQVGTGDNVLIGGFILQGSNPKKVIIRALGPSTGIVGALANPKIELRAGDGSPITSNDNWKINAQTGVSQEAAIRATTIPPSNDLESALIATLPANNSAYTVIVSGADGGTGIGLVEVYDLDPPGPNISKLANISTRGFVGTNNNVLIGGFIISGPQTKTVVIRALGPSLANQNVPGPLANPTLELRNGNGDLLQSDDNFNNPPPGSDNTQIYTYSLQPPNAMESALAPVLAPGAYTAIVRGVNNTTGIALVEAYGVF